MSDYALELVSTSQDLLSVFITDLQKDVTTPDETETEPPLDLTGKTVTLEVRFRRPDYSYPSAPDISEVMTPRDQGTDTGWADYQWQAGDLQPAAVPDSPRIAKVMATVTTGGVPSPTESKEIKITDPGGA